MSIIRNSGGVRCCGGLNILKSMEIQSGHLELSVISQVSAVEGCPLCGVQLHKISEWGQHTIATNSSLSLMCSTRRVLGIVGNTVCVQTGCIIIISSEGT